MYRGTPTGWAQASGDTKGVNKTRQEQRAHPGNQREAATKHNTMRGRFERWLHSREVQHKKNRMGSKKTEEVTGPKEWNKKVD